MLLFQFLLKIKKILNFSALQVLLVAMVLNVAFGISFYYAERNTQEGLTLLDSLWWSMVTMTTVGYGDYYAQTNIGRFLISYPCMILGIGIIGYLVGAVANYFIEWSARKRRGDLQITVKGHIIICNFPGEEKLLGLVKELRALPHFANKPVVLITDNLQQLSENLLKADIMLVNGPARDESVLHRANVLNCEGVIILAEDPSESRSDDRTYTIGSVIELISIEKKRPIKTVAELVSERSRKTMNRSQVDGIVSTDGVASCLLAQEFCFPGLNDVIGQMITATHGSQLYLHNTALIGQKIVSLQKAVLEHEANIQIIGIIHLGKSLLNPDKQTTIEQGDILIILAENGRDLPRIEKDLIAAS